VGITLDRYEIVISQMTMDLFPFAEMLSYSCYLCFTI